MNADELLNKIQELINNKGTSPKFLNFAILRHNVEATEENRAAFRELLKQKRIRVREGINHNLVEVL